MWADDPTRGSPRIRDELATMGLPASTATIRKYRPKYQRPPSQSWRTFLWNHAGAIAAMDSFVVPTATFRLFYVLVAMTHEWRKIVHFKITDSPTAAWTAQQIIKTFPDDTAPKYLLRDRDSIYGSVFVRRVEGMGIKHKLISPRSPWQNPYVERLVGSIRRQCLDRVIVCMANSCSSGDWQFEKPVAKGLPGVVVRAGWLRCLSACDFFGRVSRLYLPKC